ncbi:uncharacterized protein LOC125833012 [Solanum verrucosum]|uniref:uncharacterized protein LOC125833012 n=1 Tax=Solanum verrucosum TaxID=315347 RepID=UPI0020D0CFEE|nr:uncharacterized protein LOC125833012 [Solanum verrucosum]
MQEQPTTGKDEEDTNNQPEEQEDQAKYESSKDSPSTNQHSTKHIQKNQVAVSHHSKTTGIDLSLPTPHDPNILHVEHAVHVVEFSGGMVGGIQEKKTNLQDGVTKGRELTHVLHEGEYTDQIRDHRAPATPQNRKSQTQNQYAEDQHIQSTGKENQDAEIRSQGHLQAGTTGKHITGIPQEKEGINFQIPQHSKVPGEPPDKPPNNKSQARLSKKRRDAIKKRKQKESDPVKEQQRQKEAEEEFDEYGVNNSEDEYDQDTQSIDADEDEEEEISNQLIKAFGSTFHTEYQEEVQEVTGKQGLSPRGRKETRQTTKSNSASATISRPNTRAKSRDSSQINSYRIQLNMDKAHSNPNAKIWLFWAGELECNVLDTDEQHTTCELKHLDYPEKFIISYVYAKCKDQLRRPLWDNLMQVSETNLPWCTIGDFNVITSTQEKQGGREYNMNKSFEFISVIEPCGLIDIGYNGQPFTWCNQRAEEARIWKRLDRAMVNDKWLESMPQTTITHLPSVGSDHCPLLLEMTTRQDQVTRYFKFLNCWTENPNFYATVKECWEKEVSGNPMWSLHTKMRRLTNTLSNWSRVEYGDIFAKAKEYEEQVRGAEETLITANTEENRSKLHNINAQYIRYLKLEQSILKQKTQLHWFKEGDANTKYFHALMRGRRRRLFIHKISIDEGDWIQGDDNIAKEACQYFQNIFTGHTARISEGVLQCIPRMVTQDQNQALDSIPTLDELKQVVMSMNPHSAPGPDGIRGNFYQSCWDIIKEDLLAAVQSFFTGHIMPKFMTHACLVLLPKVDHPNKLNEFRPISLSNFSNKIISKILSTRLAPILPSLISENQSGFVRGRNISENIMLAQEIIHGIKKPKEGDNVVIKLDMAKAYDRVSWSYTCLVLRKMGFGELFIDRVWRIMSNNWYSVIINGKRHGFFHSTRGLKQGDPLSPALFILGAEVLSRMLNLLHQNQMYKGFQMELRGPQINHLSFADDIIIFTAGTRQSVQLIMKTISTYEAVSDQLLNKSKSHFMVPSNTSSDIIAGIQEITGFSRKESPINYLGCPLYIGGQRIIYYSDLVDKVVKKISGWHSRILNFGGRVTLVKHVLQSIPIHTMAAISPPKTTIKYLKNIRADFFWGMDKERKKYHWASWETLSYPCDEGAKYCQRANPVAKKWDTGQSLVWKYLLKNKPSVEPYITWKIHSGSSSFWWDNWLGNGPLADHMDNISSLNNLQVSYFIEEGQWKETLVRQHAPPLIVPIILNIHIQHQGETPDEAIWTPADSGQFSISSAWEIIRKKQAKDLINTIIWHKNVPFKVSFFIWRALRSKLPTNEKLASFGIEPVNCYCCHRPGRDDIDHILVSGNFANHIWKVHTALLGIEHSYTTLRCLLMKWKSSQHSSEVHKLLHQALPILICWNLWKNRCSAKYGGKQSSIGRVKYLIFKDIMQLFITVFPYLQWPSNWKDVISMIENCRHELKVIPVGWDKPIMGLYKLNTDGSALTNPGKIGGGGILRDGQGNLVYAYAIPLGFGTSNKAEIQAAAYGVNWCV